MKFDQSLKMGFKKSEFCSFFYLANSYKKYLEVNLLFLPDYLY